jgi:hypothetical protein
MSEQKKVCECGDVDCLKGSQSFTEASAALTAPDEPALSLDKYMDMMYDRDSHAKKVDALQAENERLKQFEAAYMEWSDKSYWIIRSIAEPKDLGKHLADIVREKFERLREKVERLKEEAEETLRANQLLWREVARLKVDAERFKYVLSQIPANLGEVFCQCLTATDDDIIEAIDAARTAKPEVKS